MAELETVAAALTVQMKLVWCVPPRRSCNLLPTFEEG